MKKRRIYLFVEGNDDHRFFSFMILPLFRRYYEEVLIIEYACIKAVRVDKFIRSIRHMGDEYLLFADIDQEKSVKRKISVLKDRFFELDEHKTVIIIEEIEGWYLAGLKRSDSSRIGVKYLPHTDNLTKEDFNLMIPENCHSRIAFMIELLKAFSITTAKRKNRSFRFFIKRFYPSALIFQLKDKS